MEKWCQTAANTRDSKDHFSCFENSWWPGAESTRSNKFFRDLIGQSGLWPAQHDWLSRYFVFERATYALEEIVAVQNINEFNGLSQKISTV